MGTSRDGRAPGGALSLYSNSAQTGLGADSAVAVRSRQCGAPCPGRSTDRVLTLSFRRMIRILFALFCIASVSFAQERKAGERPVLREPSIDKKIFGEKTPKDFFEERLKDEKCKADLEK